MLDNIYRKRIEKVGRDRAYPSEKELLCMPDEERQYWEGTFQTKKERTNK